MSETAATTTRRRHPSGDPARLWKSDRTRQAILDAALGFLWTEPFRDLTVAELMVRRQPVGFLPYFGDLHDLMKTLLDGLRQDIMEAAAPWLQCEGEPIARLERTLQQLVAVCQSQGPILRAVADAASSDEQLEMAWRQFLDAFDDAVAGQIENDQSRGLIAAFPARPIAVALNRMDAALLIERFGRHPLGDPDEVAQSLTQIWTSTLYGHAADRQTGDETTGSKARKSK